MGDSIIAGVWAALIYTVIVFVVKGLLWDVYLLPMYKEHLYKDVDLAGEWCITYPDQDRKETIHLIRNAHDLSGTIVSLEGPEQGSTYKLSGEFYNGIVTATYVTNDKTAIDRGTFALTTDKNGHTLSGCSCFYDEEAAVADGARISSVRCLWVRARDVKNI